nr:YgaP-like transmembrane domain [uncultured Pseudomonas sp.]
MVAFEPQSQPERQGPAPQNVRGWERLLSIGGGLLLAAIGASKQGERGNRQLSVGGLLLLRGLSGHCSVKSAVDDPLSEIRYLRARVQRLQELVLMAEQVADRTRATPVTPVSPVPVTPAPAPADLTTPIADEFASREQSR